jgi:hypothetical protein
MNRLLEKLMGSEDTEFDPDSYLDQKDGESEELRWLNRDELYEVADAVPESVVDYGVDRFVRDGDFSLEHFTEALQEVNDVWESYRESEDHSPRTVSESEAMAYGAGGADMGFTTNAPKYSSEVDGEVSEAMENMSQRFEGLYDRFDTEKMVKSLLGSEEIAQAEVIVRNKTDVYSD